MTCSDINFHGVQSIHASSTYTLGMPLRLALLGDGQPSSITLFLGDEALVRRLIEAINGAAVAPAAKPCPHEDAAYAAARTIWDNADD